MNNKISDLNNYLFAQLERLDDESLDEESLQKEIGRAKAMSIVSSQILSAGRLALQAKICIDDAKVNALPEFLE